MDGRRIAQVLVLLAAIAFIAFGVAQIGTSRGRIAPVIITLGAVFVAVTVVLFVAGSGGSKLADAPGHGLRLAERHLLHDYVPGVAGATSYELDLYGSPVPAGQLGTELARELTPLGYRAVPLSAGPVLASNATAVAQFAQGRWLWRVYELPLPTRFAGANYSTGDFAHLVAVTLSDDGPHSARTDGSSHALPAT